MYSRVLKLKLQYLTWDCPSSNEVLYLSASLVGTFRVLRAWALARADSRQGLEFGYKALVTHMEFSGCFQWPCDGRCWAGERQEFVYSRTRGRGSTVACTRVEVDTLSRGHYWGSWGRILIPREDCRHSSGSSSDPSEMEYPCKFVTVVVAVDAVLVCPLSTLASSKSGHRNIVQNPRPSHEGVRQQPLGHAQLIGLWTSLLKGAVTEVFLRSGDYYYYYYLEKVFTVWP